MPGHDHGLREDSWGGGPLAIPASGSALPTGKSGTFNFDITTAQSFTLALPSREGLTLRFVASRGTGQSVAIVVATASIDGTNSTITLDAIGEAAELTSVQAVVAGVYTHIWALTWKRGATLS